MPRPTERYRVIFKSADVRGGVPTCDHGCGRRARYTTSAGILCPGHARRVLRAAEDELHRIASEYSPLIPDDDAQKGVLRAMTWGDFVLIRPSSNPTCSPLIYDHVPEHLAERLAYEDLAEVNRQALAVSRILWALALSRGANMTGWPRDAAYPVEELIPYADVLEWASGSRVNLAWLVRYAGALDEAHRTAPRRGRGGKEIPASGKPHKALAGVMTWWIAFVRRPAVRDSFPVRDVLSGPRGDLEAAS